MFSKARPGSDAHQGFYQRQANGSILSQERNSIEIGDIAPFNGLGFYDRQTYRFYKRLEKLESHVIAGMGILSVMPVLRGGVVRMVE